MNQYVIIAIVALLSITGAFFYGQHQGRTLNEAAWQKREAELNAKNAQAIKDNADHVRAEERANADAQARIANKLHEDLRTNDQRKMDALAASARKLSIPARCPAGGSAVPATGAGSARDNAGARADLSPESSEFLVSEAGRADAIVAQLSACQAIIANDRNIK